MKNLSQAVSIALVAVGFVGAAGVFYMASQSTTPGSVGTTANVFNAQTIPPDIWVHVNDGNGNCRDESWEWNGATGSWELASRTAWYSCAAIAAHQTTLNTLLSQAGSGTSSDSKGSNTSVIGITSTNIYKIQDSLVKMGVLKQGTFSAGKFDTATLTALEKAK